MGCRLARRRGGVVTVCFTRGELWWIMFVAVSDLPTKEQPMAVDERWVFGNALQVENPQVGTFTRNNLYSRLTLAGFEENWLFVAVPGPNITEAWRVSAVMLRYAIVSGAGPNKIDVRDGERLVFSVEHPEDLGQTDIWHTATFPIPPTPVSFGLGVSIHVFGIVSPPPPRSPENDLRFASVGLRFINP